jgi:hypothetical protein
MVMKERRRAAVGVALMILVAAVALGAARPKLSVASAMPVLTYHYNNTRQS